MAAFRHRSHSTLHRLARRLSKTYLLQISILLLALQTTLEILQIKTWHTNQTILLNSSKLSHSLAHHHHHSRHGKIFITSLHWNNEALLPRWSEELLKLIEVLGRENIFVSVFESGSWDSSKSLLRSLDGELEIRGVKRNITLGETTHEEFVSQRSDGEEGWVRTGRGKEEMRRIPYLARLRNQGLAELGRLTEGGERFGKVLFLGDVVFSVEDVLTLLNTNGGEYAAACSLDFSKAPAFYDTFALRDSDGNEHATETWPYFQSQVSRKAMKKMEPVPVKSCWNGIVAMPAEPFVSTQPLRFRGVLDSLAAFHVEGSECCLIHADNPMSKSKGVFLNPNVRVGYNPAAYDAVHPRGLWLSSFDIFAGLWKNRLSRWASIPWIKKHRISIRLNLWKNQEPESQEPGEICLNDEMQVIVENGWAHV